MVVGVVFFGRVAMVAVVTLPQLLDVVWCSAVAVVVAVVEGSLKSNFRQYGQMKSRAGKRQREEKD